MRWLTILAVVAVTGCGDDVPVAIDAAALPECSTEDVNPGSQCSSGLFWTDGDRPSTRMRPGAPCIACHAATLGAPIFGIAGTVYPTAHEPDDCHGAMGATVRIIDANGAILDLSVGTTGNFFASPPIAMPIRAEVHYQGAVRAMCEARTSGDCNACHTEAGDSGAPGRVRLP